MRVVLLALALASVAAACSGGGPKPQPTATEAGGMAGGPRTPAPESIALELVYWDEFEFYGQELPQKARIDFNTIAAVKDDRFIPYLIDLMALPTPYYFDAIEVLRAWLGPEGGFGPFEWVEQQGLREPADDTPEYLAFKQKLFGSLQPRYTQFLDPAKPRTISAQEVMWGGVVVDGIPPLEEPAFVTPAEAEGWMVGSDPVIGVEINGDARAYPRRIIDWHEMVNDTVGGVPVSLAYCTLCGSAILYDGRVGDVVYRFGTSGMLYRSNKLMYDRQTGTLWEQYTGEPVWGDLVGEGIRLKTLPVVHTTYEEWVRDHPETKVLDINTGFDRNYGSGVAYADYFADPQLMFPAPDRSGPLEVKDIVYAVRVGEDLTAYPLEVLRERGFVQDRIGETDVVVFATRDGTGARAYARDGRDFVSYDAAEGTARTADGDTWRLTEAALAGSYGVALERLAGHNSYWFSVVNHARDWRLYGE